MRVYGGVLTFLMKNGNELELHRFEEDGASTLISTASLCLWLLKTGSNEQTKYLLIVSLAAASTAIIVAVGVFSASLKTEAQEKEFSVTQMGLTVSAVSGMTFGGDFETLNSMSCTGLSTVWSMR